MILNKITVAMVAAIFSASLGVCSEKDLVESENKCIDTNSQKELLVLPLADQSDLMVISKPIFAINSIFDCNAFIDIMTANYTDFVPMIFVCKDFFKCLDKNMDFKSISAMYNSCNSESLLFHYFSSSQPERYDRNFKPTEEFKGYVRNLPDKFQKAFKAVVFNSFIVQGVDKSNCAEYYEHDIVPTRKLLRETAAKKISQSVEFLPSLLKDKLSSHLLSVAKSSKFDWIVIFKQANILSEFIPQDVNILCEFFNHVEAAHGYSGKEADLTKLDGIISTPKVSPYQSLFFQINLLGAKPHFRSVSDACVELTKLIFSKANKLWDLLDSKMTPAMCLKFNRIIISDDEQAVNTKIDGYLSEDGPILRPLLDYAKTKQDATRVIDMLNRGRFEI